MQIKLLYSFLYNVNTSFLSDTQQYSQLWQNTSIITSILQIKAEGQQMENSSSLLINPPLSFYREMQFTYICNNGLPQVQRVQKEKATLKPWRRRELC